jgi:hypothetical protein
MDVKKLMDQLSYASDLSLKHMIVDLEQKLERVSKHPIQIRTIKEFLETEIKRQESFVGYDDHSATVQLILDKVKQITN